MANAFGVGVDVEKKSAVISVDYYFLKKLGMYLIQAQEDGDNSHFTLKAIGHAILEAKDAIEGKPSRLTKVSLKGEFKCRNTTSRPEPQRSNNTSPSSMSDTESIAEELEVN